jgi:hypothetical protein
MPRRTVTSGFVARKILLVLIAALVERIVTIGI